MGLEARWVRGCQRARCGQGSEGCYGDRRAGGLTSGRGRTDGTWPSKMREVELDELGVGLGL